MKGMLIGELFNIYRKYLALEETVPPGTASSHMSNNQKYRTWMTWLMLSVMDRISTFQKVKWLNFQRFLIFHVFLNLVEK